MAANVVDMVLETLVVKILISVTDIGVFVAELIMSVGNGTYYEVGSFF